MSDSFSTVSRTGWFARMKNAMIGIFIGILLVPGSMALLGWNEYRAIHRARGLSEGAGVVESIVDPRSVDTTLDQKLVHLSAMADTKETLRDDLFNIEQKAIKLVRNVEMYQWAETEHTESESKTGGSEENKTTYRYDLGWESERVPSENFKYIEGHQNPKLKFSKLTQTANTVLVGAYELNASLKSSIDSFEPLPWTSDVVEGLDPELKNRVALSEGYLYWSREGSPVIEAPQIGDQRIRIKFVPPSEVSLVAKQVGNSFSNYEVSNGEKIESLFVGRFSAAEVFQKLQDGNKMLAWILRAAGFALCGLGFSLILGPISVVADVIPFFGSLSRRAVGFVSVLLATFLSAITVSLSWIAFRPMIGIPLLLLAVAAIWLLFRFIRKDSASAVEPIASS